MSEDILIRRATYDDRAAILALVPRLVAFGPPPWRDADAMVALDSRIIADALYATGDDPVVLVATASDALLGFVHLRSLVDYYTERPHGHVSDVVIAPGQEGRGIASALIAAGEDWARRLGFDRLTIAVFEGNVRAAKLYERLGFGRDIVRMVKPLT